MAASTSNALRILRFQTRAWVLQEHMLAPQTLHLGSTQMVWECREHGTCESLPRDYSWGSIKDEILSWASRAENYSSRKLTKDKDKLQHSQDSFKRSRRRQNIPMLLDFSWRRSIGIFCGVQQLRCVNMRGQGKEKLFLTRHLRSHGHLSIAWLRCRNYRRTASSQISHNMHSFWV